MKSTPLRNSVSILLITLLLSACGEIEEETKSLNSTTTDDGIIASAPANEAPITDNAQSESAPTPEVSEYRTVLWEDLIPEADLEALRNPPDYLDEIVDGSPEDQLSNQIKESLAAGIDPYQQALISTNIIADLDNQAVRIPGFIVPLEFKDDQTITQFFLVPYFGACIHEPPPPPNQTVFVNYPKGLKLESLYDPFWISGLMKTTLTENDTATSAYSIEMQSYEDFTL